MLPADTVHKSDEPDSVKPNNNGPADGQPDNQTLTGSWEEPAEQDADDEAAEDTDDSRLVPAGYGGPVQPVMVVRSSWLWWSGPAGYDGLVQPVMMVWLKWL